MLRIFDPKIIDARRTILYLALLSTELSLKAIA